MNRTFLEGSDYRNLLFAAGGCLGVAVLLLAFYWWGYSSTPGQVEDQLLTTEGKFFAVSSDSQYSLSFLVEESGGGLIKFVALPAYTSITKALRYRRGENVVVKHYGQLVVECRFSGVEICSPRCTDASECRMKSFEAQASSLKRTIWTVLSVGVILLLLFAYKNKARAC